MSFLSLWISCWFKLFRGSATFSEHFTAVKLMWALSYCKIKFWPKCKDHKWLTWEFIQHHFCLWSMKYQVLYIIHYTWFCLIYFSGAWLWTDTSSQIRLSFKLQPKGEDGSDMFRPGKPFYRFYRKFDHVWGKTVRDLINPRTPMYIFHHIPSILRLATFFSLSSLFPSSPVIALAPSRQRSRKRIDKVKLTWKRSWKKIKQWALFASCSFPMHLQELWRTLVQWVHWLQRRTWWHAPSSKIQHKAMPE